MVTAPLATDDVLRAMAVITELDPGGAERALLETWTRLPETWPRHVICLGPETPLAGRFREAGIRVSCLNVSLLSFPIAVWRVRRQLRNFRADVVQTWLFHANIVGRLAAAGLGVPVVATHRVAEREKVWHCRFERRTGWLVRSHVAVSESVAQFLRVQKVVRPAARIDVIPNGVDIEPAGTNDRGRDQNRVVAAGRLHRQKGFDVLLEAWPAIAHQHPQARLTIYGEGPEREALEATLRRHGGATGAAVSLPGRTDDLVSILERSGVFVLSSRWEGMPNVVLEAAATGCPIVATDVDGVREVVGDRAALVRPDDPEALSAAICGLLADPERWLATSQSLQSHVRQNFTWTATAMATARVLCTAAGRDPEGISESPLT